MIQILLVLFGLVLLLIGWYIVRFLDDLELIFTKRNKLNLKRLAISLVILGIFSIGIAFFIPIKWVALAFIVFVLLITSIYSIQLSHFMK